MIGGIGEFVLRRACLQAAEWSQRGLNLRVSVNLSVHQLRQGDLLDVGALGACRQQCRRRNWSWS
ncbi:hypothetical protein ACPA9J_25470 [Pseudomonas aeruginosa]